MAINGVNNYTGATERGTKIVKLGNEMDKNAFLRILTAELSNQNPDSAKDSTQYVAQMAQFATLEQISNLNSVMRLAGASNLVGANVKLDSYDLMGNQYSGLVKSVIKKGNDVTVKVEVMDNGELTTKEFDYSDVVEINYSK